MGSCAQRALPRCCSWSCLMPTFPLCGCVTCSWPTKPLRWRRRQLRAGQPGRHKDAVRSMQVDLLLLFVNCVSFVYYSVYFYVNVCMCVRVCVHVSVCMCMCVGGVHAFLIFRLPRRHSQNCACVCVCVCTSQPLHRCIWYRRQAD
jgi:hypothetical protein